MHKAKIDAGVYREIPIFTSQRRKMYKEKLPPVKMEICYLHKVTKERITVEGEKTPVSRFDPMVFEKLYEVATVEVIIYIFFNLFVQNYLPTGYIYKTHLIYIKETSFQRDAFSLMSSCSINKSNLFFLMQYLSYLLADI